MSIPPIAQGHRWMRGEATTELYQPNHLGDFHIAQRCDCMQYFRGGKERDRTNLRCDAPPLPVICCQAIAAHRADRQAEGFAVIQFRGQGNVKGLLFLVLRLARIEESTLEKRSEVDSLGRLVSLIRPKKQAFS
jgi:hypothetical protein